MKKVVLSLAVFAMFHQANAQGASDEILLIEPPVLVNSTYYVANIESLSPEVVQGIQEKIARFDLFSAKGYDKTNKGFFETVHRSENGSTIAYYDAKGKVVATWERFKNVKLPNAIRKKAFTNREGWKMVGNTYVSTYNDGAITKKEYTIKLAKGNSKERLVIDALEL